MLKKINLIIALLFIYSSSLFCDEEIKKEAKKPNIYDLIVTGKFRDATKICPDGNLKDALNELFSLNEKAAKSYEKDIGKEITLTVRGLPLTGTLQKIKGSSLYLKLKRKRKQGTVVMPVRMSQIPIDDRINRGDLSKLAKNICLAVKFFRQKNYQASEVFFKQTGDLSEGFLDSLVRKSNYFMPLFLACMEEDIAKIDEVIKKGGNVNSRCSAMVMNPKTKKHSLQNTTILIEVVKKRKTKSVKHLIESGADVNAQNSEGVTPLMFTLTYYPDDTEVMEFLLKNKAKITHQDIQGNSTLSGAVALGRKDAVKILLNMGADPDDATSKGYTPVMIAVMANRLEILRILLNAGADIHKKFPKSKQYPNGFTVFQLDPSQLKPEIREILSKLKPEEKKKKTSFPGGIDVRHR